MAFLPQRGRPGVVFMMEVERNLTSEDILGLAVNNDQPLKNAPVVQRLREIHQRAARLCAAGKSNVEVAMIVGRTPQRIGDLRSRDPAFMDLVKYYETQIEEVEVMGAALAYQDYADINDLARGEIVERLEDPIRMKEVPMDELRRLMIETGDRTHTPPKNAVATPIIPTKITFNMGNRDIRPKEIIIENEPLEEIEENPDGKD